MLFQNYNVDFLNRAIKDNACMMTKDKNVLTLEEELAETRQKLELLKKVCSGKDSIMRSKFGVKSIFNTCQMLQYLVGVFYRVQCCALRDQKIHFCVAFFISIGACNCYKPYTKMISKSY